MTFFSCFKDSLDTTEKKLETFAWNSAVRIFLPPYNCLLVHMDLFKPAANEFFSQYTGEQMEGQKWAGPFRYEISLR